MAIFFWTEVVLLNLTHSARSRLLRHRDPQIPRRPPHTRVTTPTGDSGGCTLAGHCTTPRVAQRHPRAAVGLLRAHARRALSSTPCRPQAPAGRLQPLSVCSQTPPPLAARRCACCCTATQQSAVSEPGGYAKHGPLWRARRASDGAVLGAWPGAAPQALRNRRAAGRAPPAACLDQVTTRHGPERASTKSTATTRRRRQVAT